MVHQIDMCNDKNQKYIRKQDKDKKNYCIVFPAY